MKYEHTVNNSIVCTNINMMENKAPQINNIHHSVTITRTHINMTDGCIEFKVSMNIILRVFNISLKYQMVTICNTSNIGLMFDIHTNVWLSCSEPYQI